MTGIAINGRAWPEDLLITDALASRPRGSPEPTAEIRAMHELAHRMATGCEALLDRLVELAVQLCDAGSAGVSLLERTPDGETVFRWAAVAGALKPCEGGLTPRDHSPCGVCLDRNETILLFRPQRVFGYFNGMLPEIVEGLILPLCGDAGHPLGTIWIASHEEGRRFDAGTVETMTRLASFAALGLKLRDGTRDAGNGPPSTADAAPGEPAELKRAEAAPRESEARYRNVIETVNVSIWEEDWSAVKAALDEVEASGVSDFRRYFAERPEFVRRLIGMVRILDVNDASLRMFGAKEKGELMASLYKVFMPETEETFVEELVTVAEKRAFFESDVVVRTLQGDRRDMLLTISFPPPDTGLRSVPVTLTDITERKRTEQQSDKYARRLETLNIVSRSIASDLDIERIVQTVTECATQLSAAKFGAFFYNVTDVRGERYRLCSLAGMPPDEFEKLGLPRNTALFESTFRGAGAVRSDDIRTDPRSGKNFPQFGMSKGHPLVVSYLAVPVVSRTGEVHGGLFFGHDEPGIFTKEVEDIVVGIAAHAAIAIDNGHLLEAAQTELERRRRTEAKLRETERRSREVLEALPVATYTTDASGRITFYNEAAIDLAGRRPEPGSDEWCVTWRLYRPDGTPLAHDESPMAHALKTGAPIKGAEVVAERPDGTRIPFLAFPTPLRDESGEMTGAVNTLVDISEREIAEQQGRWLASVVEWSDDAIVSKDLDNIITSWNRGAQRLFGYEATEVIGKPISVLIPPDRRDEETGILERLRRGETIEHYETVRRRKDGSRVEVSLTVSPVRNAEGRIVGASKIARDISERKRAESERTVLIEELNHRVKNTLATVQSVASQTLRGNAPIAEEREALQARLIALAKLHDLLTRDKWQGAALRGVVLGELAPYGAGESSRITIDGPDLRLNPKAALALGMAVHELATNAAKYGALSCESGSVGITWNDEDGRLRLRWEERGGPPVKPPSRKGFGSILLERGLKHEVDGTVRLDYAREGVVCDIDMPAPAGPDKHDR